MSELKQSLDQYLAFRNRCGAKLHLAGMLLRKFVLFAEQENATFITADLAFRWAIQPQNCQQSWWASRLGMVRRFALFQRTIDPRTEIPPQELLPYRYHRKPPYVYKEEEIVRLLDAAQQLRSPKKLRASTYSTLFGLLAVTGMRMSEPIALNRDDVDLIQGVIIVRNSKFNKSRLLPIHPSTLNSLLQYAHQRDQIHPHPKSSSFFISEQGRRLKECAVRWTFVKLSRQIGLRGFHDSHGPRLHDLRHGFAIKTLLAWYRAGVDIEKRIHELTAYLGHTHVSNTYWYISATPELLRLAAFRLERSKKGLLP